MSKLSANKIEILVAKMFNFRQNYIIPNISWGMLMHECDLLVVRPSGWALEVEIKISKHDLKNDLKKSHKHNHKKIAQLYYAMPENLIEFAKEILPESCGLISIKEINPFEHVKYHRADIIRRAIKNKNAEKFNEKDIFNLLRLGNMRIWRLKNKLDW